MMKYVGVLEAKTHLSRLLDELEKTGEPITITRHGKPLATVLRSPGAVRPELKRRRLSQAELKKVFGKLHETQPTDPELDAMSWEELKELGRS